MAAHVYWRVVFDQSSGGTSGEVRVDELTFFNADGVDVTTGGVALSSGDFSGTFAKEQAFDKTTSTQGWASQTGVFPCWLGYQFATSVDIAFITLTAENDGNSAQYPVSQYFRLQYSDDGTAWTNAAPYLYPEGSITSFAAVKCLPVNTWPTLVSRALSGLGRQNNEVPNALLAQSSAYNRAGVLGWRNIYQSGAGRVAGTVEYTPNIPVHRKVRLIEQATGLVVREAWSDPITGAYSFDYVATDCKYTVLSYDYTGAYRAVVADGIIPEVIT